jgi:hypothetical protein
VTATTASFKTTFDVPASTPRKPNRRNVSGPLLFAASTYGVPPSKMAWPTYRFWAGSSNSGVYHVAGRSKAITTP